MCKGFLKKKLARSISIKASEAYRLVWLLTKFARFGELPLAQARPTFLPEDVAEPVDVEGAELLDFEEDVALELLEAAFEEAAFVEAAFEEAAAGVVDGAAAFLEEEEEGTAVDLTLQLLPATLEVSARFLFAIASWPWAETSRAWMPSTESAATGVAPNEQANRASEDRAKRFRNLMAAIGTMFGLYACYER